MPSSPYRQKGRRFDRHQSNSKSSDRNFGADSRKKVHKDREYEYPTSKRQYHQKYDDNRERDTNRDINRQSRYQKKPTSSKIPKELNKYDSGSKIQTIEVKFTHPPSDLKVHFRFKPLKINQKNQDQLLQCVKEHFSEKIGPVEYFSRSYDSKPGNLIIQLGFKYDFDALLYLSGKKDKFQVKLNGQQLDMIAEPTQAFKMLIPELQIKKKGGNINIKQKSPQHQQRKQRSASKQKHIKRRKSSSSSRSASSSSSSRSHSSKTKRRHSNDKQQRGNKRDYYEKESRYNKGENYDRNNNERSRDKPRNYDDRKPYQHGKDNGYPSSPQHHGYNNKYDKYDSTNPNSNNDRYPKSSEYQSKKYENSQKQQQQIDNDPNLKTLFFFGVHYSVNSKDMTQLLYNHKQGPFYSKKFIWRRMNNSISEFLQGRFEISQANKLLQISSKMQVKGHPFIIIQGTPQASNQYILQKLSQFQVQIQFPRLVQPYYLLKSLMQCGRLIQIVSINKLNQQGRSDFYNITFNSSQMCGLLKQVKKTSSGILIQEVNQQNLMLVYRPNSHTELMESKFNDEGKDRNNHKDVNQDRDNKSEASRSYSRKSQF